jgi:hypothetical protein
MPGGEPPQPTELIYLPRPSWIPMLTAVGLVLVVVGLMAGLVYLLVGALIAVPVISSWIAQIRKAFSRLPREQRPATAVLPALPPRSRGTR